MDATTMPSILSLITRLSADYPDVTFAPGDDFTWSPLSHTVSYDPTRDDAAPSLLHELSHAILGHSGYERDVALITMERAAWDHASSIAATYDVTITPDHIEQTLDSYRDWLHARSTCPSCQATGVQTKKQTYSCLACRHSWHVNEARICGLRRTQLQAI